MNPRIALCSCLIAASLLMMMSRATVTASICPTVTVSSTYPHHASPNQQVQVTTTVAGSCTSDGEDYFAVRVDLADGVSNSLLSSNSVPIGYNANNFSVTVQNAATVPPGNQTWRIEVDAYMIQAGGLNGKYLLNATAASIEVGSTPVPEFQADHSLVLLLALTATLVLYRRQLHNGRG